RDETQGRRDVIGVDIAIEQRDGVTLLERGVQAQDREGEPGVPLRCDSRRDEQDARASLERHGAVSRRGRDSLLAHAGFRVVLSGRTSYTHRRSFSISGPARTESEK